MTSVAEAAVNGLLSARNAERPVAGALGLSLDVKRVSVGAGDVIEQGRREVREEVVVNAPASGEAMRAESPSYLDALAR